METLKRLLMRFTHRYVHPNVKIGKGTYIHPTAVIYDGVTIGENCYIGAYCIIGAPAEYPLQDMSKKFNGVEIGDDCQLHGHNTVDAGMEKTTVLRGRVTMMKGAHIGHDCSIYWDVTLSCGSKVGGKSIVGTHCTLGLNSTVHQKSYMNNGTMLGAGSFYKIIGEDRTTRLRELECKVWVGSPAKPIKENSVLLHRLNRK